MNGFVQLIRNLCYLSKFSLKEEFLNGPRKYEDVLEDLTFRFPCKDIRRPKIFTPKETAKALVESNLSFARFGDGEISLIEGCSIPFQEYNKTLAKRLKEVLTTYEEGFAVGINYWYFNYNDLNSLDNQSRKFAIYAMPKYRKKLLKYINWEQQYLAADIADFGGNKDYDSYFDIFRKIWDKKKVLIICCKNACENLKFNLCDNASDIQYLFVPNRNSYSVYDDVIKEVRAKYDKDTLICLAAGPAAKVWAYDLSNANPGGGGGVYRTLDLGHLFKAYDWCKQGIEKTPENIIKFCDIDE